MAENLIEILPDMSSVDNSKSALAYADQIVLFNDMGLLAYMSAYGYNSTLEKIRHVNNNINDYKYLKFMFEKRRLGATNIDDLTAQSCGLKSKILHIPDSDYSQLVRYVDVEKLQMSREINMFYIRLKPLVDFIKAEDPRLTDKDISDMFVSRSAVLKNTLIECPEIHKKIFTILQKTDIPFLEEWVPYCLNSSNGIHLGLASAMYADINSEENVYAVMVNYYDWELKDTIAKGLHSGGISINQSNTVSVTSQHITTLTQYLASFSDQLIDKASKKFEARFTPETDKFNEKELNFFDYTQYVGSLDYYNAQKNVIGAINRSLDHNRAAVVVGECGAGKSALAIGSIYTNSKIKNSNTVIMAPGHLVEKWKREIERLYPGAIVKIIATFNDLLQLEHVIKDRSRKYPLFMVLSKDTAKINYIERPAVIWNSQKHEFFCPHCASSIALTRAPSAYRIASDETSANGNTGSTYSIQKAIFQFTGKAEWNKECMTYHPTKNTVHGKKLRGMVDDRIISCGHSLWTATHSREISKWIKHPSVGYIHMDMMEEYKNFYENASEEFRKDALHKKMYQAIIDIEENGSGKTSAPRRYSIARYIHKHLKGYIDYFVADEVHEYSSGTSAQAAAFGDIARVATKTIALTGTLLNGYANGIYYILYRLFSRSFKKKGFAYAKEIAFINKYGVKRTTEVYSDDNRTKTSSKILPGVSPELFTDFLLDKAVFISLEDMSNALPSYTEHPVKVELEENIREEYEKATGKLKSILEIGSKDNKYIAFMAAQKLNIYPDMPYKVSPIVNKNNKVVLEFNDAIADPEQFISNKDIKCLEIIQEKLDKGENVLVYINFINKTNCVERLDNILTKANIKHCILDTRIKTANREAWIDQQVKAGCRVMICNPTLVETGLDLLAFTNIIFYQVGYNLFTMRQAARRSRRLNQPNTVNVYFLYYENTTQETVLSLMANKLQAAMAIEGKFTEEGLNAMSNNDDILTQIADSLIKNIEHKVEEGAFATGVGRPEDDDGSRFTLVNIINDKDSLQESRLFESSKRKNKYWFKDIYNELAHCLVG